MAKNTLLLSELDAVRDRVAELGDDDFLACVLQAEIDEIFSTDSSDVDDDLVDELRLLDRSRRDFEAFREEKLAELREDLAAAQNVAYLKFLEADRRELQKLATR
jgi:hypothetical protein